MNAAIITAIAVGLAATAFTDAFAQSDEDTENDLQGDVHIGVIYPLTGDLAERGTHRLAGAELGAADFNEYLASMGQDWRLVLNVEDTETKPNAALDKAVVLHSKGIKMVIGPAGSGQVLSVKSYADENNMLILSCCSTSPTLAIPGDSIFRLAPDDSVQGLALARLVEHSGIEALVPIYRQDDYGSNLARLVQTNFETRGVVDEGIAYDPQLADYSASVSLLAERVQSLADEHGADKVAVLIVSYDEIIHIVQSASSYPILEQVRWFAGESIAKESFVLNDRIASEFVDAVNLTAYQIFENRGDKYAKVTQHIVDRFNVVPATYVYQSYDAAWLIGLSILEAGTAEPTAVKDVLPDIAQDYEGALGSTKMNAAGDLLPLDLAIWQIRNGSWSEIGKYSALKNVIIPVNQISGNVTIGAVYPLTGDLSNKGPHRLASTQLGIADFNDFVRDMGYDWQMNLQYEDSATQPVIAEEKVKTLFAKGVDIIVGIPSSANVKQVKQYVDKNSMLVVNCCSTAPSLAIAGDNIFRIAPDDANQGRAMADLMEAEGIEAIVAIWRNDDYGNGLAEHTYANFGGVTVEGIPYDPNLPTMSSSVSLLAGKVENMIDAYGAEKVAVIMISFDESLDIVQTAASYDFMDDVRWFGSESLNSVSYFADDRIANGFINAVQFTTLFPVQEDTSASGTYARIVEHIQNEFGTDPESYVSQAYDAPWLVGLSIMESGSAETDDVKAVLPSVASTYSGALASTVLNEYGDLVPQDLTIWEVVDSELVNRGTYLFQTGAIVPSE